MTAVAYNISTRSYVSRILYNTSCGSHFQGRWEWVPGRLTPFFFVHLEPAIRQPTIGVNSGFEASGRV
jgi:hypothetical protein